MALVLVRAASPRAPALGSEVALFCCHGKTLSLIQIKKYASRKCVRPISIREFNHVIFKARVPVLRRHRATITRTLRDCQLRYGLRLKAIAIMENHIHLAVKVPSRKSFADFMRVFAGTVALGIMRGKLWSQRVWSRIVRAGRDLRGALEYIWNNPLKVGYRDHYRIVSGVLDG